MINIENRLNKIIDTYQSSFSSKIYLDENNDHDILMNVFGITPLLKRENRQYWGRELGMCWQLLIIEICKSIRKDFVPAMRIGSDEPCDLIVGNYAIDTKYRIGSGDSGTLKKFKAYGPQLKQQGFHPLLLILREDNLPAAINACRVGGWEIKSGEAALNFIHDLTQFDIKAFLLSQNNLHQIVR